MLLAGNYQEKEYGRSQEKSNVFSEPLITWNAGSFAATPPSINSSGSWGGFALLSL
jgi:hypothetical protein